MNPSSETGPGRADAYHPSQPSLEEAGSPIVVEVLDTSTVKDSQCIPLDALYANPIDGRYIPCLDILRVYCVIFVAIEHGDSSYGKWNVLWGQDWVLQWLFIIGGISYGLTSKPLCPYLLRLGLYAVVGVAVNWFAWIVCGMDWAGQPWDVVFQFWFVVGLMLFCVLLAPVKSQLSWMKGAPEISTAIEEVASSESWRTSITGGLIVLAFAKLASLVLFWVILIPLGKKILAGPLSSMDTGKGGEHWGWPTTEAEAKDFITDIFNYFQVTVTSILVIYFFRRASSRNSLVGWLIILNVYGTRCFEYRGPEARMANAFDLVLIGLVGVKLGLAYCRVIGMYIIRYWMITFFTVAIIWKPGTHQRYDEDPPEDLESRLRYNSIEMIMTIILLCAGEQMLDPKIFTKDNMYWLNDYGLALFLTHKAVHLIFNEPFNWLVIVALAPLCFFARKILSPAASQRRAV